MATRELNNRLTPANNRTQYVTPQHTIARTPRRRTTNPLSQIVEREYPRACTTKAYWRSRAPAHEHHTDEAASPRTNTRMRAHTSEPTHAHPHRLTTRAHKRRTARTRNPQSLRSPTTANWHARAAHPRVARVAPAPKTRATLIFSGTRASACERQTIRLAGEGFREVQLTGATMATD